MLHPSKILIVDDEPFNVDYLARIIHESQTRPWDSLLNVL